MTERLTLSLSLARRPKRLNSGGVRTEPSTGRSGIQGRRRGCGGVANSGVAKGGDRTLRWVGES